MEIFKRFPYLPQPGMRWTPARKVAVLDVARNSAQRRTELKKVYKISEDELLSWEKAYETFGKKGLRVTVRP